MFQFAGYISTWSLSENNGDGAFAIVHIFTSWRSTLVNILNYTRRFWPHLNQIINVWSIDNYQLQENKVDKE